ncbi:MAG TPA: hypothetical protein ENG39_03250 [Candidatus Omnitrophica bacterium]|nr:hypothetical protein [Candidatus Omnitrophota bacterium]
MPFGMGPAGWFMVPYVYPYLVNLYSWWGYYPWYTLTPFGYPMTDELSYLKQLKQNLEAQLQDINMRINELEKQ